MNRTNRRARACVVAVLSLAIAACDSDPIGPGAAYDPQDLDAHYEWEFTGWAEGSPLGYPVVRLSWEVPSNFRNEPFRVYAAYGGGSYGLIATVTSCTDGICHYSDTNVIHGRTYDYYVATFDERDGREIGLSEEVRVEVPEVPTIATPAAPSATALDGAVYLQWEATEAQIYHVLMVAEGSADAFLIGQTDGTSFLDDRAENGVRYDYYIAGANEDGHVGALSQPGQAVPRPDFHADIVFAHADLATSSGFRFVSNEDENPVRSGVDTSAQWRLEAAGGDLMIRPLGQTAITDGTFTTALTCGPGSDATCEDVNVAPASSEFGSTAVVVEPGNTYFLRVLGSDGQTHYAKLRVQGRTVNTEGRRVMIFDWAYQLRANEPRVWRGAR